MAKRVLFLFSLFLLLFISVTYGQITTITQSSYRPTSLSVGGASGTFKVNIINTGATAVSGYKLKVALSAGAQYVAGTVVKGAGSTASITTNPTESSITDLQNPVFALPVIPSNANIFVEVNIALGCAYDNATASYSYSVVTAADAAPSGNPTASHAGLTTVITPTLSVKSVAMAAGSNSATFLNATEQRLIIIRNSGSINVSLPMLRSVIPTEQTVVSYTNVAATKTLTPSSSTLLGFSTNTLTIPTADIAAYISTGNSDNIFQPGEEITLVESTKLTTCVSSTLLSTYTAAVDLGATGSFCSPSAAVTNLMSQQASLAVLSGSFIQNIRGGWVGEGEISCTFSNTGSDGSRPNSAAAFSARFSASLINITSASVNGVTIPVVGGVIRIDQLNTDPGIAGLKDLDGDGFYDDMPGGTSFNVIVKYKVPNFAFATSFSLTTNTACGTAVNTNTGAATVYSISGIGLSSAFPVSQLVVGTSTTLAVYPSIGTFGGGPITFYYTISLPDGVEYDPSYLSGAVSVNGATIPVAHYSVSADRKSIQIGAPNGASYPARFAVIIPVKVVAQVTPSDLSDDLVTVRQRARFTQDIGYSTADDARLDADGYFSMSSLSYKMNYAVADPVLQCANTVVTTSFDAQRTSLTYSDQNQTIMASASNASLNRYAAFSRQKVTQVVEGTVNGNLAGNVWTIITYNAINANPNFKILGGRVLVNGVAKVSLGDASAFDADEYSATNLYHTIKLNLSSLSGMPALQNGDAIRLEVFTQVGYGSGSAITQNEPAYATSFSEFSGALYTVDNGVKNQCNRRVVDFTLGANALAPARYSTGTAAYGSQTFTTRNIVKGSGETTGSMPTSSQFPGEAMILWRGSAFTSVFAGMWAKTPGATYTVGYTDWATGITNYVNVPDPEITYGPTATYLYYDVANWPAELQNNGFTTSNFISLPSNLTSVVSKNETIVQTTRVNYSNYTQAEQQYRVAGISGSVTTNASPAMYYAFAPVINLLTQNVDGYAGKAALKLRVTNNTSFNQPINNMWVAVDVPAGMTVNSVTDVTNSASPINYTTANGGLLMYETGKYWIKAGDVNYSTPVKTYRDFTVNVSYNSCDVSTVKVYGAASAYGYPDNPAVGFATLGVTLAYFKAAIVNAVESNFTITPKATSLDLTTDVTTANNRFCTGGAGVTPHASFTITNNTTVAAEGIYVTSELPVGFNVVSGTSKITYFDYVTNAEKTINIANPVLISGNNYKWDIAKDPNVISAGVSTIAADGIKSKYYRLSFDGATACGYVSGSRLSPKAYTFGGCGATLGAYSISDPMYLAGAGAGAAQAVVIQVTDLNIKDQTGSTTLFKGRIVNSDAAPTGTGGSMQILFNEGINISGLVTYSINGGSSSTVAATNTTASGQRKLVFPIPAGIPSNGYMDFSLNLGVSNSGVVNCQDYELGVRSVSTIVLLCDGVACATDIINAQETRNLTVQKANIGFTGISGTSVFKNATTETATIKYKIINNTTAAVGILGPTSYVVDFFDDANANGTYDSGETIVKTENVSTAANLAVGASSAELTSTFDVPVSSVCNLKMTLRFGQNPRICSDVVNTVSVSYVGSAATFNTCNTVALGQTALTGVTYQWVGPVQYLSSSTVADPTFNFSGSLATTTTFTYNLLTTRPNGCVSSTTVAVTVPGLSKPALSIAQPGCGETTGSITVTAPVGAGFTYSLDGGAYTTAVTYSNLSIGSHSISAQNASGCTSTATVFTINSGTVVPVATFSYPQSTYCATGETPAPTVSATAGAPITGTLFSGPIGLRFKDSGSNINSTTGVIDLANSSPGVYTVALAYNNASCSGASAATFTVTIKGMPTATISYAGNPFCGTGNATPTITNTTPAAYGANTAGTFGSTTGLVINASTGVIDLAASTAGTYTVTYTFGNANGCTNTATTVVGIGAATFGLTSAAGTNAQTLCVNSAITDIVYEIKQATGATVTGLPTGLTYNYASTSASTGTVTISGTPSVSGVFTYTVTSSGGCAPATVTGTVTSNAVDAGIIGTDQTVCNNSAPALTSLTAATGVGTISYTWQRSTTSALAGFSTIPGATLADLNPGSITASTWYVRIATSTINGQSCTATSAAIKATVQALPPTAGAIGAAQTICTGATPNAFTSTTAGTVAAGSTLSYQWQSSTTSASAGFADISGATSATYASGALTQTTWFRRYTVGTLNGTACRSAAATTAIAVTINADAALTLSSAAATNAQTKCVNTAITNITYTVSGTGSAPTISGLPTGVTAAYNTGTKIYTISGTPTVSGTFAYTVTSTSSTGCATATATGTITVSPAATITLSSTTGTDAQSVCVNNAITSVVYSIGGTGTGATVSGLPAGVTYAYSSGSLTISGTPTAIANATYTITATGTCASATKTGTLSVTSAPTATLSSAAGTDAQSVNINTALTNIVYTTGGTITSATVSGLPTGVTGTFNSGTNSFTISGTPTVAGSFPYTITAVGNCQVTKTGTITVNGNASLTLSSAAGTNNQTLCINTAITNITYSSINITAVSATGLPTGVTGSFNTSTNVYTITGTPSVSGTFNYTLTGTGPGNSTTANGTIIVTPNATIALGSAAATAAQTLCISTAITNITYNVANATGASVTGLPTGVTGAYSGGVFTISGTPTVSGAFNYTVTTSGGCSSANLSGTITVTPNATIALSSAAATAAQTLCISTAITNITYTVTNGTGATVTGLPAGVTGTYAAGVFTISGTPTASGTFNYTVTTVGGCSSANLSGTITVTPNATIALSSAAATAAQTKCISTALTNITYAVGNATGATVTGLPTGLTGAYSAGVFTISGTPTVSGVFNYTVTTTGGCSSANLGGTITVTPNAAIALSSAAATAAQTLCISTAITNITYAVSDATSATVTGLPAGVTGTYAAGVFTISGTPTASGAFNYTVTTIGGCSSANLGGTITVTPNATIALSSAAATAAQTLCISTAITNITYAVTNATGATVTGLPAGVTGTYAAGVFTVSGTPTVSGAFNYTVTTTGGCSSANLSGTLTVTPNATIALSSAVGTDTQTKCINAAITDIAYTVSDATGATVTGLPAGVTGTYAAGVFTISGTPTASGSFNYTVTTTGGCSSANLNGTLTVTPNATIALSSAAATAAQTLCISTAITDITYTVADATGATVTGLPAGVTGTYSAGVFTISGTPTASGTFNYTVTTTGGCSSANLGGTITVTPNATIALSSAAATAAQTLCINTAITNITYAVTNGTGATVAGLPAGVTGAYSSGVFTISGTPTASGTFNYTVTTTGGCSSANLSGTITVTPNATIALSSAAATAAQTKCISTAITNITYAVTNGTGATVTGLPAGVTGTYSAGVFTISGTPTASGTFNYTVTTTGGCSSANLSGTITVTPNATIALSSAAATAAQTLCVNTAITNITYAVTNGTGATVTGLPAGVTGTYSAGVFTISGTPTASGTFNYTVTTTGGCSSANLSGTLTVTPNATIALSSAAATAAQTLCVNTAITNITYAVTNGTGATVTGLPAGVTGAYSAGVFTISGTPTASGTFNYTVTTTGGCSSANLGGTITVTPNATIALSSAAATAAQTLCINTAITNITYAVADATGATVTGLPTGVTGTYSAGVFTISGTPTASGTFNYTVTTTGGCSSANLGGTITVTPNATIALSSAAATAAQTLCINTAITNITYAVTNGTGATVTGLPAGVTGAYSSGVFTISGTPTASGTFNYTVTTTGGCSSANLSGTLTVTPNATIALSSAAATAAQTLCINTAITNITYAVTNGTGATVTGLPAGVTGTYAAGVFTISGTPTASGTFNYTVTTTGGCSSANLSGTITVTPDATIALSSAAATSAQTLCINTAITNITYAVTNGTGATVTGLPAGVTGTYAAGVFTISGTPTASGTFNYTVTTTGGCSSANLSGTITVTPNATIALSSAAATAAQTLCINTAITNITYAVTNGTGATVTGLPAGVTGTYAAGVFTISGTPTASGTFNYTVTTTGGCSSANLGGTITVTPNATIALSSAAATAAQTLCINTAITNITYAVTNGTGATVTGLPAGVTGAYSSGVFTISGTPTASGTFNYTVTTTGGCSSANLGGTITVTPNATIALSSAAATAAQTLCINTAITNITYAVTNGTGATVTGLPAGVTGTYAAGVFTISGTPTASGTFNYTVTTTGGCSSANLSGTITVTPSATIALSSAAATAAQSVNINTAITNITYAVTNGTGATVTGLPAGVTGAYSAGVFTISGTPTVSGTFNYTVTTTGGCSTANLSGTITVNPDVTIVLSSAAATSAQNLNINTAITDITYSITNGTSATVTGLPTGLTGTYAAGVFTISGTPTVGGTFNYTVTATGAGASATANGSIVVNSNSGLTLTSAAATAAQTLCVNTAITNITYSSINVTAISASGLPSGVNAAFNNTTGEVTISGTPTASGTFNYTITGTGPGASAAANGTITVTPNATIALSSAAATAAQTLCINTAITNITYSVSDATGATVTGLPAGVTGTYSAGVFTISGTPTASGTFNYTVTTTGGCSSANLSGTITVTPNATIALSSAAATAAQTLCINTAITNITYAVTNGTGATVTGLPAGVTGTYAAGVFTISGTPTASGTFNYTVTTTGGCSSANLSGTITVTPNATIALSSAAATAAQTLCINTAITNITYAVTNGTGATVTGLPAGVTGTYAAGVFTISGTPTASGTFNYTVTTTGGCSSANLSGTITVTPNATIALSSAAATAAQTLCINTAITNITYNVADATGATVTGLPAGVTGTYAAGMFTISGTPTASGTFNYTVTTTGGCSSANLSGTLTVTPSATIALSSAAATAAQSVNINTAITNITYSVADATGATVTGLPAGVTGTYAAGIFTISGTPTASGTFNYTVTTTGGCSSANLSGTITVNPDVTIVLSSAASTSAQNLNINTAITDITYTITNGTNATVTGLPTGVTGTYAAGVFTISGTPTVGGTFNYTVTATGAGASASATGSIVVNSNSTLTLTSAAATAAQTLCINTAITNITYASTNVTGITASGLPSGVSAVFSSATEEVTISGTPTVSGTLNYTITGTGPGANAVVNGTITVTPNAAIALSSAAATAAQTLCINTAITNITYAVSDATGATVTGLPAGVTGVYSAGVFTISGTPTASGTFNYTVTTVGGCSSANLSGTITVTPNATIALSSAAATAAQTLCINTAVTNITYAVADATGATVTGLPAGVTGSYAAGVFTISGTPTVSGTFNYTVTTTGGCSSANLSGTITVTPNATIALSSAAATSAQTLCINTAVTNITYAVADATGATVTGLPAGVTGSYAAGVFTISGTPTASGTFNYTVTTVGGCSSANLSGTITVTPDATIALSSAAATSAQTLCINTAITNITYAVADATGATVTGLPAGVTGVYSAGVFTISGTPTASGTFNYTVTTVGGCSSANLSGTITVTPNATIALSSAAATAAQTLCINTAVTNITYAVADATGATVTGLPAGVTGTYAAGVFTISGTPTASGTFNYTVTTVGGCSSANLSGTITVTPNATIALSSAAATSAQTLCINTAVTNITYAVADATGATVTGLPAGVTGTYSAGVFTISGTPTASGTFNYTVTTVGGCSSDSKTGTITVTPDATIALSSAAATSAQTLCINTAVTNITYNVADATGATVTGLPAGVTGTYSAGVFTISGTPTASGTFNYTVTTVGGCSSANLSGTITVTPNATIALSSAAATSAQTLCINTAVTNITYAVADATGATVTGLPAGVTGTYAAGVFTISGTPTASGTFNYTVTTTGGCSSANLSGTITVTPNATIALSSAAATSAQTLCINTAVTNITYNVADATGATVTGLPVGVTGTYSAGVFTISGTPTASGTFNYTVTTVGGCSSDSKTGTITVTPNATIALSSAAATSAQTLCINTAVTNITYTIADATGATVTGLPAGVTGTYAAGVFTISGTPTASGTFNYTVTTVGGCSSDSKTGTITVTPDATIALSSAAATAAQTLCINTAITNITYTVTNGTGATVTGLPAGVTGAYSAGVFTISGTPTASGTFNYTVTTVGGCSSANLSGTITVTPNATIALSSAAATAAQTLCINTAITNITYAIGNASNATVTGLPAGVTGSYNAGIFRISGTPTVSGTFNYTVTTTGCNPQSMVGQLIVGSPLNAVLTADHVVVSKGDIATLTVTTGGTYEWTGPDIIQGQGTSVVKVRPRETTTYMVKVTSPIGGCIEIREVTIQVIEDLKVLPSNVMSPNGDGKNDTWIVKNLDYYPNNKVTIFNRSGRKVFYAENYQNTWDGSFNGLPLTEDTYYYVIDPGKGFTLIKGSITIIRDFK